MRLRVFASSLALLSALLAAPLAAQGPAMPDPKEIAGVPLPVSDVPAGTVTVRVIRGTLANNLAGEVVELLVDGAARRQTTGESGRAEFTGLRPGARVKAVAVVAGERLESQEFAMPADGGTRLLLVATDPESAKRAEDDRRLAAASARPGTVVLSEQSRFVVEMGDEALNVFTILQIENTARTPVATREPVVFESAPNGGTITVLQGSSPRAVAEGRRVVVNGPFPPGPTMVQFAYAVPYAGPAVTIEQRIPLGLNRVMVLAQKVGEMQLSSPQIAEHREMSAQGERYIVGQGPGIKAGDAVTFAFTGLPHAPRWPRNVALAVAAAILAAGAWAAFRGRAPGGGRTPEGLEAARDRLFSELAAIERQQRGGLSDPSYHSRRRELVAELESVYAALDRRLTIAD